MVLLVDDEPIIREMVKEILSRAGVAVLTAVDGQDGLDVSRSYAGPVDVLLADVRMPRMSGPELAACLRAERPRTKVLLMSGYPSPDLKDCVNERDFIGKPFDRTVLFEKIQSLLELADVPEQPKSIQPAVFVTAGAA